ncbi:MAG: hypothetical protein KAI95_03555, partial [Bacteroidales bacterium]|nr:hypothetical protein [Bacteroidales bacterium]
NNQVIMRRLNIFASFIAAALIAVSCGGPQKMADNASLVDLYYKIPSLPFWYPDGSDNQYRKTRRLLYPVLK